MAAEMTEIVYNVSPNLGGKIMKFEFVAAASGDWVIFDDPIAAMYATDTTGAATTTLYATPDIAADFTATATSVAYDGATAEQVPASGYILVDNEIIKYSGASKAETSGTFTLDARGCFGTTAADHSNNDVAYVLNSVVFTTTAGLVHGIANVIDE